jgi:hypothetical protein
MASLHLREAGLMLVTYRIFWGMADWRLLAFIPKVRNRDLLKVRNPF